jgi:hypothetical protein
MLPSDQVSDLFDIYMNIIKNTIDKQDPAIGEGQERNELRRRIAMNNRPQMEGLCESTLFFTKLIRKV